MSYNQSTSIADARNLKQAINKAVLQLEKANIEDAKHNANLMAAKLLNISYTQLPLYWSQPIDDDFCNHFSTMLEKRCNHEPLQYILGEWSFLELDITSLPGALIPRPETEEVFLAAVDAIKANNLPSDFRFADIGTGTGILGIATAKYFPTSSGTLVDISDDALKVAEININRYSDVKNRVRLIKSDLLEGFTPNSLDVIISNPPYIDSDEIKTLMPEVLEYEPHLALDGGPGGLVLIEKLLLQAEKILKPGGILVFEHGHGQRKDIKNLLSSLWIIQKTGDDFAGKERYFVLIKGKSVEKN